MAIKILSILMLALYTTGALYIGRKLVAIRSIREFIANFATTPHSPFEQLFFLNFRLFPKMYLGMVDMLGDKFCTAFFRFAGYFFLFTIGLAALGTVIILFTPNLGA